ncbi:MAG: glycogen/starch synthase [Chitinispirillia bacterium]|nr:glycogen/starch synthase [Chitinispirillia bacterium]MCL2268248.1 glycogen/starch synthase [Chitinispirillia bacterium]
MHRKPYTASDAAFTARIDAWQPYPRGFLETFGPAGFKRLSDRDRLFCAENRKIVALTFENHFAPLGGLAAVMRLLPACLRKAGEDVVLMTPLYVNIPRVKEAMESGALVQVLPDQELRSAAYKGTFCCYSNAGAPVEAYYIGIGGRFTAEANPYSYADPDDLLDDALAFCAAVPVVLNKLGFTKDILFHAQDWETAPIALTSKIAILDGVLESARTVLTLHNSFDCGIGAARKKLYFGIDSHAAAEAGGKDKSRAKKAKAKDDGGDDKEGGSGSSGRKSGGININGDTILQASIPLLNAPLTTVSAPFANELRYDTLQRTVFTNHLQDVFDVNQPAGIENGMFGKPFLKYTYASLSWARQGNYSKLLKQKARFRAGMLDVVRAMQSRGDVIGGLKETCGKGGDVGRPIFFMSGRLDLSQKGFDVIFQAVRKLTPGKAGLIFCPSSADKAKHSKELAFFKEIADEMPGDIVAWPFRVSPEDYVSVLLGSSFLLMPSFYEPFGAATEGFMHGAPVIARATGGLLVQVRSHGIDGINDKNGVSAVAGPPALSDATGILYRESAEEHSDDDWKTILESPVVARIKVPLYKSMVDEAQKALLAAVEIFGDSDAYGRMIINGIDSLGSFSWDAAVAKYRRVYDIASRRGFFDD